MDGIKDILTGSGASEMVFRVGAMGALVLTLSLTGADEVRAGLVQIVVYDLAGAPGTQTFTEPHAVAANITGLNLTRGPGLIASNGSLSGLNTISATGWHDLGAGDYFSFGFVVDPGYQASLNQLEFRTVAQGTGPGNVGLYYSGDNFSAPLTTFTHSTPNNVTQSVLDSQVDLSALANLQGTVEFRLYALNDQSASQESATIQPDGAYRVGNRIWSEGEERFENPFNISGTITAVPEPSTFLLTMIAAAAGGVLRCRRRSKTS